MVGCHHYYVTLQKVKPTGPRNKTGSKICIRKDITPWQVTKEGLEELTKVFIHETVPTG